MTEPNDLTTTPLGHWLRRELEARTSEGPANQIEEGRLQAVLTVCRLMGPGALGPEADKQIAALLTPERERAIFLRWRSAVLAAAIHQPQIEDLDLGYLHATLGIAIAGGRADDPPADAALLAHWMEDRRLRQFDDQFDLETRKVRPEGTT